MIYHRVSYTFNNGPPRGPVEVVFIISFFTSGKFVTVQCKNLETNSIAYGDTLRIDGDSIEWRETTRGYQPLSLRLYPIEIRQHAQKLLKLKAFW